MSESIHIDLDQRITMGQFPGPVKRCSRGHTWVEPPLGTDSIIFNLDEESYRDCPRLCYRCIRDFLQNHPEIGLVES